MRAVFYYDQHPVHEYVMDAMFEGAPKGVECVKASLVDYRQSDVAVMFGMAKKDVPKTHYRGAILQAQRNIGAKCIVIDSGYIKRGAGPKDYYSVGFNGLNGRADFRNWNMPSDRWDALEVELMPYRKLGSHIVLCGQVPWDASVQHVDYCAWVQGAGWMIRAHSNRPFVWRPHPNAPKRCMPPEESRISMGALEADFRGCWAVVTFNSNTAVDAVIKGYPIFAFDRGSMAWPVANHEWRYLETPRRYTRQQWAANLAYAQWTPDEMREGKTWRHLFR